MFGKAHTPAPEGRILAPAWGVFAWQADPEMWFSNGLEMGLGFQPDFPFRIFDGSLDSVKNSGLSGYKRLPWKLWNRQTFWKSCGRRGAVGNWAERTEGSNANALQTDTQVNLQSTNQSCLESHFWGLLLRFHDHLQRGIPEARAATKGTVVVTG